MVELVLFIILAAVSVGGALVMVFHRNPVYSALSLAAVMLAIAVFYVVNNGHLIAAVQVIVYAGAVMTLFLFVIMLIGVDRSEDITERLPLQRPVALGGAGILLAALVLAGRSAWVTGPSSPVQANGTVEAIADRLFDPWVLAFEATTLLLIVAAVGALALAQYLPVRHRKDES